MRATVQNSDQIRLFKTFYYLIKNTNNLYLGFIDITLTLIVFYITFCTAQQCFFCCSPQPLEEPNVALSLHMHGPASNSDVNAKDKLKLNPHPSSQKSKQALIIHMVLFFSLYSVRTVDQTLVIYIQNSICRPSKIIF